MRHQHHVLLSFFHYIIQLHRTHIQLHVHTFTAYAAAGADALVLSCGLVSANGFYMLRGAVPLEKLAMAMPSAVKVRREREGEGGRDRDRDRDRESAQVRVGLCIDPHSVLFLYVC